MSEPILLVDANRGIYTYQEFAKRFKDALIPVYPNNQSAMEESIRCLLEGPDNEFYAEEVGTLSDLAYILVDGVKHYIYNNDEGVWAISLDQQYPIE